MTAKRIKVTNAPGFKDFEGYKFATAPAVDDRGPLMLVIDDDDAIHVVPSKHVTHVTSIENFQKGTGES